MNKKYMDQVLKRAETEYQATTGIREGRTLQFCLTFPIKSSIQLIAELITQNKLKPCVYCEKDGVSMGYVRRLDVAGSLEYDECPSCKGWTVVEIVNE